MELESAVNAPLEIEIKGKSYKITEYTLYDFALFRRWLQKEKLKLIGVIEDEETRSKQIDKILNVNITDKEVSEAMMSIEGITFLLWRMLITNHPDMELEDVIPLVNADNMNEIVGWIGKLSPYKVEKKKAKS